MFPEQTGRLKWEYGWEESYWWARLQTVAAHGDSHAHMLKTVEEKLRLPWPVFDALAREMEADPELEESQAPNRRAVPLRLKLCAALRHLATANTAGRAHQRQAARACRVASIDPLSLQPDPSPAKMSREATFEQHTHDELKRKTT
tara:strand:+ start:80 stop:517 length:438 start_codon:yes stop_codon:yes gene_type:complete